MVPGLGDWDEWLVWITLSGVWPSAKTGPGSTLGGRTLIATNSLTKGLTLTRILGAVVSAVAVNALAVGVLPTRGAAAARQQPLGPIACAIAPDEDVPVAPGRDRRVYC